jgi:putative transposase
MSHTYCCALFHCIFSTKDRRKSIPAETQTLSLPSSMPVAKAMREIKAASSRWMHETCNLQNFEWQEGYGAFSIGRSQTQATLAYIGSQPEHHKKQDFQAEFIAFLKKNRIEYDSRYIWG